MVHNELDAFCVQGTGTAEEMALEERTTIATEGCVIADVTILRPPMPPNQAQASTSGQVAGARREASENLQELIPRLRAHVRVKTLAMWTDQGRLGQELCRVSPLPIWNHPEHAWKTLQTHWLQKVLPHKMLLTCAAT
jgi:hypothetical protein